MNKEEIKEQLKLSKKQNKETRYNYIAQTFNPIEYAIKLEKYVTKILKENQQLKEQQLKEQLEKERKARKEAIKWIESNNNSYKYWDKQGNVQYKEEDYWDELCKPSELLKILDIDKGE